MAEITLTKDNFAAEVLQSDKTVLVDFWAGWCAPCIALAPVIGEIAAEMGDSIKVGKVNVDEQEELAVEYGIASIPTILVFRNGEIVNASVGLKAKERIVEMLK